MPKPRRLVVIAACAVIAVVAVNRGLGRPDFQPTGHFSAPAPYRFNEPFLAWPQGEGDRPTLEPAAKSLGTPLRIDSLAVPVGGPGHHEVVIGRLAFARGVHSRTTFRIANGNESVYRVAGTRVEFRSLVAGAPPFREVAIDRPLVDGIEPVEATLVWDVDFAAPGAVMEIRDLFVE